MVTKVLYISGTRADYGWMRNILKEIDESSLLELEIIATGMHIMSEFGKTHEIIENDGFTLHELNVRFEDDTKESMAVFIGELIESLTRKVVNIQSDIILVMGDRSEMLAGAIVGAYLSIPVAHIRGGEISSTVDESVRHAITKLAHIHFPITQKSRERIIKMGEDPKRVFLIGTPELEAISRSSSAKIRASLTRYALDYSKPIILVLQHPVTMEIDDASMQIKETMEAISELGQQTILIYPNADSGSRGMIKIIKQYEFHPFITIFKNIPRDEYLNLLKISDVLVGNSSSGITEAPFFGVPVINIGSRQYGRERALGIINVGYDREEIKRAIEQALYDEILKYEVQNAENPYLNGSDGKGIVEVLANIKIDTSLLQKRMMY